MDNVRTPGVRKLNRCHCWGAENGPILLRSTILWAVGHKEVFVFTPLLPFFLKETHQTHRNEFKVPVFWIMILASIEQRRIKVL